MERRGQSEQKGEVKRKNRESGGRRRGGCVVRRQGGRCIWRWSEGGMSPPPFLPSPPDGGTAGARSQCTPETAASPSHSPSSQAPAPSFPHSSQAPDPSFILAYSPCSLAAEPCSCSEDTSKMSRVVAQWSYQVSPSGRLAALRGRSWRRTGWQRRLGGKSPLLPQSQEAGSCSRFTPGVT